MRLIAVIALCLLAGCNERGQYGYGWRSVKCYSSGFLVYSAKWEKCPEFAGTGFVETQGGEIIKAECRCSSGD